MTTPIDQPRARLRALVTAGLLATFAACTTSAPLPDAAEVDAQAIDAPADTPADTPADAAPDADPCWTHEHPQCGNVIYDLCVPFHGCAFYTCEGETYGYCGPQG